MAYNVTRFISTHIFNTIGRKVFQVTIDIYCISYELELGLTYSETMAESASFLVLLIAGTTTLPGIGNTNIIPTK